MLTPEQREMRKNGLGASDTPILMGYSTYKTPYQLYLEKTGIIEPEDKMTEQQLWGHLLEPVIAQRFADIHETSIELKPDTLVHPEYPFIMANLDAWLPDMKAVLEAKNVNAFNRREWNDALEDGIPKAYLIQLAKQVALANLNYGHCEIGYCAVLINGFEYKDFIYKRDLDFEAAILEADKAFWHQVQNRIEPSIQSMVDCKLKFRETIAEKAVNTTFSTSAALDKLIEVKANIKSLEKEEEAQKMKLMTYMQDAEYLINQDDDIVVTWKKTKKGNRVFNLKGI